MPRATTAARAALPHAPRLPLPLPHAPRCRCRTRRAVAAALTSPARLLVSPARAQLLRAWEAELRMGADDVGGLLGPAIERAWLLGAPQLAPLAPLLSALLRGHVMRAFVPAYSEYTLAEDRRLPPPSPLPPPPLAADAIPIPLPPLLPADGADNDGRAAAADARAPLPFGLDGVRMGTERLGGRVPRVDLLQREGPDGTIVDEYGNAILEVD
jgi:hypothetical protein